MLQRTDAGYVVATAGGVGERLRAEPFAAVDVDLDATFDFGEDPAA